MLSFDKKYGLRLLYSIFPMDIASVKLDVNNSENLVAADIDISKRKSVHQSSELLPCKSYENSVTGKIDHLLFYDCSKDKIRRKLESGKGFKYGQIRVQRQHLGHQNCSHVAMRLLFRGTFIT
jgi:hypothetical protein